MDLEIGKSNNGQEYCKNAKPIVEEALRLLGLQQSGKKEAYGKIAEIVDCDISTVYKWVREGYGSLDLLRKLVAYFQNRSPSSGNG
jgi:hypothetical protein